MKARGRGNGGSVAQRNAGGIYSASSLTRLAALGRSAAASGTGLRIAEISWREGA
jgi:hypothetical protein